MPERFRIIIRNIQPLDYNDVRSYIQRVAARRNPLYRMTYFNSADNFGGKMYFNMDDQGDIFTRHQRLQNLANGLKSLVKFDDQRSVFQLRKYIKLILLNVIEEGTINYDEDDEDGEDGLFLFFDGSAFLDDLTTRVIDHGDTKWGIRVGDPYLDDPINRVTQHQLMLYVQNFTLAPIIRGELLVWLTTNYDYEADETSSDEEEEEYDEEDQLRDLLDALPEPAKPIVGKVYTLDEFRTLLPTGENFVSMGTQKYLWNYDCGLNTNTAPKTEPVVIQVQRNRRGRGLRFKYEWDRSGDTLYVFCASKLRDWLRTKVPNYNRLQDTNPFNNKIIYRVKYLTQKEADEQWNIRVKEKKKEEKLLGAIRKDASENPMLQMFVNRIEKTQKELAIYSDDDTLDYAFEDVSMAIDDAKRDLKKLKTGIEVVTSSKLLQDKDKNKREGAKKILEALRDETIQKEEELERLEARAQFLSRVFKDLDARQAEIQRLLDRSEMFRRQYNIMRDRLTPNTKALNTKAPNNKVIQRMAKLKF